VPTREIAKSIGLQCEALFEAPLRPEDFSARHYFPAYDASVSISCYLGLTFKEILCIFIVSLIFFVGCVLPPGVIYLFSVASGAVDLTPPVARPTRLRTCRYGCTVGGSSLHQTAVYHVLLLSPAGCGAAAACIENPIALPAHHQLVVPLTSVLRGMCLTYDCTRLAGAPPSCHAGHQSPCQCTSTYYGWAPSFLVARWLYPATAVTHGMHNRCHSCALLSCATAGHMAPATTGVS